MRRNGPGVLRHLDDGDYLSFAGWVWVKETPKPQFTPGHYLLGVSYRDRDGKNGVIQHTFQCDSQADLDEARRVLHRMMFDQLG